LLDLFPTAMASEHKNTEPPHAPAPAGPRPGGPRYHGDAWETTLAHEAEEPSFDDEAPPAPRPPRPPRRVVRKP
jgi:hypothetical protein